MKEFLGDHFFLDTATAQKLYFDYAEDLPILDYHNHLSPEEIAKNTIFENLTEAWLSGDHYKWRAMRANGVAEEYITSDQTSPEDKFRKWAETVPYTARNPLFHWTHLELRRYFGINELLSMDTAEDIYLKASELLTTPDYSVQELLKKMKVEVVCTTDDPLSDLKYHDEHWGSESGVKMFPTFRPDVFFGIDRSDYTGALDRLSELVGFEIKSLDDLLQAAKSRIAYFHEMGCRLSDHGFEQLVDVTISPKKSDEIFRSVLSGNKPNQSEVAIFKMTVMTELSKLYHKFGWVQQLHLGAIRNVNSRIVEIVGKDAGVDSIGDYEQITGLARFLDHLDQTDQLCKTIVYNLNPADSEAMATMMGNFNDGSIAGKMQYGAAWWFLDQRDGIAKQLDVLSNMGLLSKFVGMLTDSRSFLSFPRHEYFRRILCNLLGTEVEKGELPNDLNFLGSLVHAVCYENAKEYFGFNQVVVPSSNSSIIY